MDLDQNSNITIENERVRLEPLSMDHHVHLVDMAVKYPQLLQYSPSIWGTEKALRDYIEKSLTISNKHPFAIFDKRKDRYAGSTSFMNISQPNLRLEIGSTWLGKDFQRTGLNRNCKYLLLSYAFDTLKYNRVELKTDARNLQSRTAIEAIGAQYEGLHRHHTIMTDGHIRDTVYYSIIKSEWPEVKTKLGSRLK